MITKDFIYEVFEDIRKKGEWDTNKPLVYGYFFTGPDKKFLKLAADELEKQGYIFESIFEAIKEEGKPDYFYLRVEKVEQHTVDSLDKRNLELYQFANTFGLESYDGFDIGAE